MTVRRSFMVLLSAVLLSATVVAFFQTSEAAEPRPPAWETAAAPPVTTRVPDAVAQSARAVGIVVAADDTSKPASVKPNVSADDAGEIVRVNLGFGGEGSAVSATLARATTPGYGKELELDVAKPSRIEPTLEGRRVWVVAFEGVPVPLMGPLGASGGEQTYVDAPLIALVDPGTGELLFAASY